MFKDFLRRIATAENKEDAIQNIFYGTEWAPDGTIKKYSIERAEQAGKITHNDANLLLAIIEKMA